MQFRKNKMETSSTVKRLTALILVIVCIFSLCSCSTSEPEVTLSPEERKESIAKARANKKVHDLIKKMIDFDIDDEFIDEAEMTSDTIKSDTYGRVRIIVKNGKETELMNLLQSKLGNYQNINASLVPSYQGHPYADEIKHMTNIRHWVIFKSGVLVKSIDINIYVAQLRKDTILYIFG